MEHEDDFFLDAQKLRENINLLEDKHKLFDDPEKNTCYAELNRVENRDSFGYLWPFCEKTLVYKERFHYASMRQSCLTEKMEINYVITGTGDFHIRREAIPFKEGDMLICGKSLHHSSSLRDDAIILNCFFDPLFLKDLCESMDQYNSQLLKLLAKNILEEESYEYILIGLNTTEIRRFIEQILNDILNESGDSSARLRKDVISLLHYLIKTEKEENNANNILDIKAVFEYLTENISNVTLKSAAEHFHFSESAFSKQIKRLAGEKFSDVLRDMKLKKAIEYLEKTDMSIESIAQYLNYSNRYSFERSFQSVYGMLPREYKALHCT